MITQDYVAEFPIDDLEEHPENPRRGDVPGIAASIEANDFYGAVIVQKSSNRVVAGNHRLKASRLLGRETIPAIILDIDDDRARRIMLVDNRTNDMATYADAELAALLSDLAASGSLIGTGYLDADLADILERLDPPSLDELHERFASDSEDEHLTTVTLKLHPDVAIRFRSALEMSPGNSDSERISNLLDAGRTGEWESDAD